MERLSSAWVNSMKDGCQVCHRVFYFLELDYSFSVVHETLSLRFIPRKSFVAFGIIAESATNPFNLAADLNGLFLDLGGEVGSVSLGFDRTQDGLLISWPTETTGLKLHRTDSLSQPNWVPVAGVVDQKSPFPWKMPRVSSSYAEGLCHRRVILGCRKTYWCRA